VVRCLDIRDGVSPGVFGNAVDGLKLLQFIFLVDQQESPVVGTCGVSGSHFEALSP
jgi:hypothetical protein